MRRSMRRSSSSTRRPWHFYSATRANGEHTKKGQAREPDPWITSRPVPLARSGGAFYRKFQNLLRLWNFIGLHWEWRQHGRSRFSGAAEVLINWKESVRFKLAKCPAELLLNAVQLMEKLASIQIQLAAAQFPIST